MRHPADGAGPARAVTVHFEPRESSLWLRYAVEGEVDHLLWPEGAEPVRTDNLWATTCFEAFVETPDGYVEFNLSPSGAWASYAFDGYRQGMRPADQTAIVAGLDGAENQVALEATIELPAMAHRLGLSAVIEAEGGAKTYWALAHPSERPDFHHTESFAVTLSSPEPA
ncbi:DOMON-like domain-containing protein [Brevundimonas variabilis]|uniref:DOMON-like domain-containing protein n=1 Tax=Brevundimonas variabilis TaxID=74312 RepID=UPI001C84692A|nr:DOMON-like domain-containing protein [Brevundimonas variabilis]